MATRVVLTYKDYEALPADGRHYELHEGELSVTPAPTPAHQRITRNLLMLLQSHVETRNLGEVLSSPIDCILSDSSIVQPDLVYLDQRHLSLVTDRGIEGPPTLAIEILSPSTVQIDRSVKSQLYARYGIAYYWIVDPAPRTIEAYRLRGDAYELADRLEGQGSAALEPFTDLPLLPARIWP
jgi:Uma2 family endonuclease